MPKNHDGRELCHFTYADGRRCNLPQFPDGFGLCYHHGQKYRANLESKEAGRQISQFVSTDILTASDISNAIGAVFSSTAQGYTKPKAALALGYLAQLMIQVHKLAKEEFLEAYQEKWPKIVQQSPAFRPDPDPEPEPETNPASILAPEAPTAQPASPTNQKQL